jgi:two-component system response regulator ResD
MRPKALVVEDDDSTRQLLRQMIESQCCDVDEAKDGGPAIDLLDKNDYSVILLDIVLPKISGADVLDHLHRTNPGLIERVIVVTGLSISDIRKLFPTVCNALPKPVMPKRLVDSIQKCLRGPDETLMAL